MSDSTFSLVIVTSIFTVGGLSGSLFAKLIMDKWDPRGAHRISAILIAFGTTFMGLTSIFTVGGLSGSLFANLITDKWGRRGAHRISAILIVFGTTFMGLSNSVSLFLVGR